MSIISDSIAASRSVRPKCRATRSSDLWLRLLAAFPDPASTAFGLMNEPAQMPIADWAATAQQTVDALRKKGAKQLILVPGGGWSGAHSWRSKDRSGVVQFRGVPAFPRPGE